MQRFPHGARVAFIGDSITHLNNYVCRIAAAYREEDPACGITFRNCGISGGSATSAIRFFGEDIAPFAPTHATVMLGVNDSCRDALRQGEAGREKLEWAFARYEERMRTLFDLLEGQGTRMTLLTPVPYAEFQPGPEEPLPGGEALIARYAGAVRALGAERGAEVIDLHGPMLELYRSERLYRDDRVHPEDRGFWRMAEIFLEAQGFAPREFVPIDEVQARAGLTVWDETVGKLRDLYAAEWMVIPGKGLTPEASLAAARDYIANFRPGDMLYLKQLAEAYLQNKPRQAELIAAGDLKL